MTSTARGKQAGSRRWAVLLGAVLGVVAWGPATPSAAAPMPAKEMALTATPETAVWSEPVKLAMEITPRGGGQPRGGTVTFLDGDTPIGTATATTRLTTLTTTGLAPGTHTITATYAGDTGTAPGTSDPVTVTVGPADTTTTVAATTDPVTLGERAELRAVVRPAPPASPSRRPTGTVTFTAGDRAGIVRVNANGVAVWRPTLAEGTHAVTATYSGDAGFAPGAPAATTVTVGVVDTTTYPAIAAGAMHGCGVVDGGAVRCWGEDGSGQLGDGNATVGSAATVPVTGLTGVTTVGAGALHSCAVLGDGTARCWGQNAAGQLGDGTTFPADEPVVVVGLTDAVAITGGESHTCALLGDQTVSCWGSDSAGQLGNGSEAASPVPVPVPGLTGVVAVDAGREHTCAVLDDGTARCWGYGASGELGNGASGLADAPVAVDGLTDAVGISAGDYHSCAVLGDGTARCWGYNWFGQLGDDGQADMLAPVAVVGLTGAVAISTGGFHSCAALEDGTARCWGYGEDGQLGDGNGLTTRTPVVVSGLSTVTGIALGGYHSCAVLDDGSASCWGDDQSGQLGNGEPRDDAHTPVVVSGFV